MDERRREFRDFRQVGRGRAVVRRPAPLFALKGSGLKLLQCREFFDSHIAKLDRIAVSSESKVALSPVLSRMRCIRHQFCHLAEVGVQNRASVQFDFDC